jgi:hypothetical protein
MKVLLSFETSRSTNQATKRHIPDDLHPYEKGWHSSASSVFLFNGCSRSYISVINNLGSTLLFILSVCQLHLSSFLLAEAYVKAISISGSPKMRWLLLECVGQDSVVGIATRYELDGRGIESLWGRDFQHSYRLTLGPTQPPVQWVPGHSRG